MRSPICNVLRILQSSDRCARSCTFPCAKYLVVVRSILYINGFKVVRGTLNEHIHPAEFAYPDTVRLGMAMVPGIVMTPISSVLEACNAGKKGLEEDRLQARGCRSSTSVFPVCTFVHFLLIGPAERVTILLHMDSPRTHVCTHQQCTGGV